jgi:ubiquinone/menaquinone biosynthesis C-methylase UbiE
MFEESSYVKHKEFINNHTDSTYVEDLFNPDSPVFHYNNLFFEQVKPIIKPKGKWLTVGDATGIDAAFLKRESADATASDLSDELLKSFVEPNGYIDKYCVQNVEKITFEDDLFDFVYCKEAYHHFPRPAIAFYEMLRVAKKGVVIQEPNDISMSFAPVLWLRSLLDKFDTSLMRKFWKNQYSYEVVGNFVYKISYREFEKMAVALNLPCIAVTGLNSMMNLRWANPQKLKKKKAIVDFFSKLGILPYQHLTIIIFKEMPTEATIEQLKGENYKIYKLPKNPYS